MDQKLLSIYEDFYRERGESIEKAARLAEKMYKRSIIHGVLWTLFMECVVAALLFIGILVMG